MARNDGGPAFPRPIAAISEELAASGVGAGAQDGMTLRDYLAAKALAAVIVGHPITAVGMGEASEGLNRLPAPGRAARDAYAYADAMLAARDARPDAPADRVCRLEVVAQAARNAVANRTFVSDLALALRQLDAAEPPAGVDLNEGL